MSAADATHLDEAQIHEARANLAFMRALVEPDDRWLRQFGETYSAAGFCYCAQMLLHAGQFIGLTPATGIGGLAIGLGPTVVFLALLVWIIRRNGPATVANATSKAVGAVFGAVGLTNLALVLIIGSVAIVGLGWFVTGLGMALFIDNMAGFVATAGAGMFLFMLLPGLWMLRRAQPGQPGVA